MTPKYNPFAMSYPPDRGPLGIIFRPVIDYRTYLRAGHMLLMFPLGIAYFVFFVVSLAVGGSLIWTLVGPVILLASLFISRWLGDLEAFIAARVNGTAIRRPPSRLEGVSNFRSQVKVRLVDPTTWTGLVYLIAQFPIGIAAFVSLMVLYSISGAFFAAPLVVLFTGESVFISGIAGLETNFDTVPGALILTPFGVMGFIFASHVVITFSSMHGWWAKLMLGSRSTRVSSKPTPVQTGPTGDGPPKPSTTANLEGVVSDAVAGVETDTESPEQAAPTRFGPAIPPAATIPPVVLTPVPNPSEVRSDFAPSTAAIRELTSREQEVFMLMAHGDTNADIAEELFISEGTVKTHVKRVLSKLYIRDRTQVVVFAYEQGLVTPQSRSMESQQTRAYGG